MSPKMLSGAALSASLLVHAGLLLHRSDGAKLGPRRAVSVVALSLLAAPEPPLPPPLPTPTDAPKPKVALKPKPTGAITKPVTNEPEPAAGATPAPALTGTTLVSDVVASWSAPAGTEGARDGAVGSETALIAGQPPAAALPRAMREPPRFVPPAPIPLGELSRKPTPPSLTASLARNYPESARQMGQSGDATVRALVEPSGEIRQAKITRESSLGFGEACRRSLVGSQWGVPLDHAGQPAATWITYRCRFRVDG